MRGPAYAPASVGCGSGRGEGFRTSDSCVIFRKDPLPSFPLVWECPSRSPGPPGACNLLLRPLLGEVGLWDSWAKPSAWERTAELISGGAALRALPSSPPPACAPAPEQGPGLLPPPPPCPAPAVSYRPEPSVILALHIPSPWPTKTHDLNVSNKERLYCPGWAASGLNGTESARMCVQLTQPRGALSPGLDFRCQEVP